MGLDISSDAFNSFAFFAGVLALKVLLMSPLTGFTRMKKKAFANPEDLFGLSGKEKKVTLDDPDVERTRRAHLNDLENVVPFLIIGFLYCCTHPDAGTANLLFKIFTIARYLHTFVYAIIPIPQPARALSFFVAMGINVYMTIRIILHFA